MADDKPTPDQLERLKKQLLVDKGPSTRQQSYQFVYWKQIGDSLGQPFDMTKIPMSKLYQMRRDPMIAFALHYIKVPLIRAPWYIKCEDAQVAAFIDTALRRIYARLVLQYMLSLDFGFSAIVKRFENDTPVGTYIDPQDPDQQQKPIWSHGNVPALMWKSFVPLAPQQVEPLWTQDGEFKGIRYDNKRDVPIIFPVSPIFDRDDAVDVPLESSLWITNERDSVFGSPWGYPRIGYAFRYWWSYWYRWALADRHFEKDADPPAVVRYPNDPNDESLDDDGNTIDYRSIALGIGEQARSGSTIAMPSDVVTALDARLTNMYQWDIKHLEGGGNFDAFDKTFDRLEILKLRSIWVPEQAFLEGSGGTSSRNVAATMTDSFQEAQAVLMAEFDDHINRYVIPQLVKINFPEFEGDAKKITKGFGSEDLDLAKALIQAMANQDANALEVDFRTVLRDLGIPLKSPAMVEAEKQKAIEEAQAMMPPDGIAAGPGQAGTTKAPAPKGTDNRKVSNGSSTGFSVQYVQPREHINLSSDEFNTKLPRTPHYQDETILANTVQNRNMWRDAFANAYEDFANHISHENFDAVDVPNKPGVSNWVEKHGGLPKFIADIAGDLITERGMTTSHAIATAVSRCKVWAAGGDGVSKKTQAKAAAAIAEWEKKKGETKLSEDALIESFADDSDGLAKRIVDAWKHTFESLHDRSLGFLHKIISRAGELELRKSHFTTESWNPSDAPADWAQRHGASLVKGVDDTVRSELRGFLANEIREGKSNQEIADDIREHFSGFPGWKAERLARTETMLAYNFATLYAGKSAGVTRVQAIDAQKGATDDECERRNGKIFNIDDAFGENLREHPNGTLSWRLLRSTKLSVQKVPKEEVTDGKLAWYDPFSDVIYMAEDIDPDDEEKYLLTIGATLSDSPGV